MSDDERTERRMLIQDLMDSAVDPWPLMKVALDSRGPDALTTAALRQVRAAQQALVPGPEMGEGGRPQSSKPSRP